MESTEPQAGSAAEESALIVRCQQGDTAAFGILYDRYVRKIYDFIFYKTFHKETAEDLTSLVFTKALNGVAGFTGGSVSAWLYRIARNAVIDHYRTAKTTVDIADVWNLDDGRELEIETDLKRQLDEVKRYLKTLSAEQRDIVIMRVWQGMSYAEIAAALGKTESSSKMMFMRTVKKMRKELQAVLLIIAVMT